MPRDAASSTRSMTRQNFFFGAAHMVSLGIAAYGSGRCQRAYRVRHPIESRRVPFYCLILITKGAAQFDSEQGGETARLAAGSAFFLFPGETHGYGVIEGAPFEETWVAFGGPTMVQGEAEGFYQRHQPVRMGAGAQIGGWMEAAFNAGNSRNLAEQKQLPGLIHQMVIALDGRGGCGSGATDPKLEAVRCELASRTERALDLEQLAARHGLGYSSMRSRFREAYGVAPGRYHVIQRLNAACACLSGGASVAEAAEATGFDDPFYFSRLFRRQIGLAPRQFARRTRKWVGKSNRPADS